MCRVPLLHLLPIRRLEEDPADAEDSAALALRRQFRSEKWPQRDDRKKDNNDDQENVSEYLSSHFILQSALRVEWPTTSPPSSGPDPVPQPRLSVSLRRAIRVAHRHD